MSFGKEIWHGIRQALRASQYCCHYLWNTWLYVVFLHIRRGSTMLRMCPWEFHHCMYVTSSPRELTSCLLPGHICTNRLRFRRQLMWTPSPPLPPSKKWSSFRFVVFLGAAVRTFQGGLHWINSAWTFFRHRLVVRRSEKNRLDQFVVQGDGHPTGVVFRGDMYIYMFLTYF